MNDPERPLFISTLTVTADAFARRHPEVTADQDQLASLLRKIIRSAEDQPR